MTPETPREKRIFDVLFLALIALHLALMLSTRLYPFTDLPDHLAAAAIARHTGDPSSALAHCFRVDAFPKPNTFHLWFCSLPVFPSAEAANRALFALYVILFPLSALLALRKLGGDPRFALLSFLLVYNYSVSWGFVGFALAVPLAMLFCRFFVFDERGVLGARRAALAAAALLFLYFVHVLAALFCALLVLLRLVSRRRDALRALPACAAALLPLAILVFAWWRGASREYAGTGLAQFLGDYYRSSFAGAFLKRKSVFIFDNYHLLEGVGGYVVAAFFSLGVVVPAAIALRARARGGADGVLTFLAGASLCCLFLPNELPQQAVLYERFSVFLMIALILFAASRLPARLPRAAAGAFAALAVLHYLLWAQYFFAFNRENAGFDREFLRPDGGGKKLAGLVLDYTYRGRPTYIHFPSYYIVWEKEVATASLADFRFGAVRRGVNSIELPRYLEWVGKRGGYDGRYGRMDYLLLRGGGAPEGFELERAVGKWALYRNAAAGSDENR
jgi:hypothetical protein